MNAPSRQLCLVLVTALALVACSSQPKLESERVETQPKVYSVTESNNAHRVQSPVLHASVKCNRERAVGSKIKHWACELVAQRNSDRKKLQEAIRDYHRRSTAKADPDRYLEALDRGIPQRP